MDESTTPTCFAPHALVTRATGCSPVAVYSAAPQPRSAATATAATTSTGAAATSAACGPPLAVAAAAAAAAVLSASTSVAGEAAAWLLAPGVPLAAVAASRTPCRSCRSSSAARSSACCSARSAAAVARSAAASAWSGRSGCGSRALAGVAGGAQSRQPDSSCAKVASSDFGLTFCSTPGAARSVVSWCSRPPCWATLPSTLLASERHRTSSAASAMVCRKSLIGATRSAPSSPTLRFTRSINATCATPGGSGSSPAEAGSAARPACSTAPAFRSSRRAALSHAAKQAKPCSAACIRAGSLS
eukprot:scaffold111434_cov63-Phaeocystis_antarctica.AAC.5